VKRAGGTRCAAADRMGTARASHASASSLAYTGFERCIDSSPAHRRSVWHGTLRRMALEWSERSSPRPRRFNAFEESTLRPHASLDRIGWRLAMVLAFVSACRAPAPATNAASAHPIVTQTPCAARLIVRNHGRREVELAVRMGDQPAERVRLRGLDPAWNIGFASSVLRLPDAGATGTVHAGGRTLTFDSRAQPRCPQSLKDDVPSEVPADYDIAHTLFPRNEPTSALFPGIVLVTWKAPVDSVAVDAWVRAHHGSYIAKNSVLPHTYQLWFHGDDTLATVATRLADELMRTSLVTNARPKLQIF
jgi:hypothetical protein